MRKLLIALGALAALIGAGIAAIYLLVDVNQFRPTIQAELQKQLHRSVTLGAMGLGLFPLGVRVDDLSIGENPQFPTGRPFVTAKQIRVRAQLFPLLRKEVTVDSVVLTQPVIELVKNAAGQWNYSDLTSQPASANTQPVSLALLQIDDGSVAASQLGASRSVYDHVNVELTDLGPGKTFHVKVSAQVPGGKSDALSFDGSGGPTNAKDSPFQGKLLLTEAPLGGLARFAGSTLPVDGKISGTADLQSAGGATSGDIKFELKDAVAEGKALGFPISLNGSIKGDARTEISRFSGSLQAGKVPIGLTAESDSKANTIAAGIRLQDASLAEVLGIARLFGAGDVSGTGVVSAQVDARGPASGTLSYSGIGSLRDAQLIVAGVNKPVRVQSAALKFGKDSATVSQLVAGLASSSLKGSATVTNFASPSLSFDFDIDKVDVDELEKVTTAPAPAGKPASKAGASPALTAKGSLHVGTLLSQGLTLTNVRSQCVFDKGVLSLSPLTAQLFGGTQSGSLRADTRQQPAAVALNLKLDNVDANQLLSAVSSAKNTLYGNLGVSGDLNMMLGSADMARTLNGKLNLSLTKGRFAGTNVLSELSAIGKFTGLKVGGPTSTNITKFGGDFGIVNGLATTDNMQLAMDGGSLSATGTINLADQILNLKATAVLDRGTSQQAGGVGIGGYMSTALSNNKGELVIPANVTGTFAKPHFAPDPARMAELKLKNILPSTSGQGVQGILGAISGKQPATGGNQPPKTDPKQGVQGVIDLFRKKK